SCCSKSLEIEQRCQLLAHLSSNWKSCNHHHRNDHGIVDYLRSSKICQPSQSMPSIQSSNSHSTQMTGHDEAQPYSAIAPRWKSAKGYPKIHYPRQTKHPHQTKRADLPTAK